MVAVNDSWGRRLRLHRLYRHGGGGLFVVPLDHTVTDGPIATSVDFNRLVESLVRGGVDAVVLHKGRLRHVDHEWFADASLIVHMSASTVHAPDPDAKVLGSSVEEASRLGADAVSVHVNLGSQGEARQLSDMAEIANACDRWSMPLLAMMYPRGPGIGDPRDPDLIAHAVTLAADLGADVVKTNYSGSPDTMADIVHASPIPVVVAGGPKLGDVDTLIAHVREVLRSGVAGVAMGRNVFGAKDPEAVASEVAELVHYRGTVTRGEQSSFSGAHSFLAATPANL